jgi:cytochrome c-type biogenesis protein CcmH
MIWLVFALLTGSAVLGILWPLSRPAPTPRDDPADVAFYRAQMVEIDADLERGAIDADQAQAAKAQAGRRLLAAATLETADAESPRSRKIAAVVALIAVPAVALGLYAKTGSPDLPDMPREARLAQPPEKMDIAVAVAKIEAHIAAHPEDGRAYEVVAPVYLRMGRFDDAIKAREQALKILGPTPERYVRYAEALAYGADGTVIPEAEAEIEKALALDPKYREARYFLGLAAAQHDDAAKAKEVWTALIADLPENSQVRKAVAEKLAMLDAPVAGASDAPIAGAQPSRDAAAAVAALPSDQQQATIRSMVARLAARLDAQGGGVDEWMRLIRAYKVLNEQDKSQAALSDARKALKDDASAQQKLAALAQELELKAE